MGKMLMAQAKQAARAAFCNQQKQFSFYNTQLSFQHAYDQYYQCVTPDGGEIFRMVALPGGGEAIMDTNTRQLMTETLRMECNQQMKKLYEMGMTRHQKGLRTFCDAHSEAEIGILWDGWTREYGFREESENLVFYIRCRPIRGDYQAYIYIYTKHFEEKMNEGAGPKTHERINGPGLD